MKRNNNEKTVDNGFLKNGKNREHVGIYNNINENECCSIINLYVPIELNLSTLLIKYSYNKWTTKIRLNKLYYLLSQISEAMLVQDIDENKGYVSLNIQRLENIICKGFPSKGLRVLERIGVIKIYQPYSTNRISKGYKFTPKYNLGIKCIEIFDKKIFRKLKNTKER